MIADPPEFLTEDEAKARSMRRLTKAFVVQLDDPTVNETPALSNAAKGLDKGTWALVKGRDRYGRRTLSIWNYCKSNERDRRHRVAVQDDGASNTVRSKGVRRV